MSRGIFGVYVAIAGAAAAALARQGARTAAGHLDVSPVWHSALGAASAAIGFSVVYYGYCRLVVSPRLTAAEQDTHDHSASPGRDVDVLTLLVVLAAMGAVGSSTAHLGAGIGLVGPFPLAVGLVAAVLAAIGAVYAYFLSFVDVENGPETSADDRTASVVGAYRYWRK